MKKNLLFICAACNLFFAHAQVNLNDSIVKAHLIQVELGIGLPEGDLKNTFGLHEILGGGYQYKTEKNVLLGINGGYYFGSNVKDTTISFLLNENQFVVGLDGSQFSPILSEQAFDIKFQVGKITNLLALNPNSGITFLGGVGFFQHNILIISDKVYVPQLSGDYKKGYDHLTNGFALSQYIGYYFFSNKNYVNFRCGFEFVEAFTKNRRSYNFDSLSKDDAAYLDLLISFKATWNLTIFENNQRKYYY